MGQPRRRFLRRVCVRLDDAWNKCVGELTVRWE